jgi:lipopolysaccharide/colanic/teichoic acid biosynthesis glycosyltransferase
VLLKYLFDIFSAFIGLLIILPILLVISIAIKIKMPGPVLFKQRRVGRSGKLFVIYKFRTMNIDHGGSSISIKGEKRITPLGALLRKYKLDELPELWNVLIGDMSLVGPRPDVPGYADKLQGNEKRMLSVRPGITGLASLKYRNEEEILSQQDNPQEYNDKVIFPDKVRINLIYLKNRSFLLDMKILVATILNKELEEKYFI